MEGNGGLTATITLVCREGEREREDSEEIVDGTEY